MKLKPVKKLKVEMQEEPKKTTPAPKKKQENKKTLLIGGICCGAALSVASALQQYGIALGAEAGKAGFITALYIIIVPIIGIIFFKKRYSLPLWIGVGASLVGLYFLCMTGESTFGVADILLVVGHRLDSCENLLDR